MARSATPSSDGPRPPRVPTPATTAVVACPAGDVIGVDRGGTAAFTGIRYAGVDRFRPPQDITSWTGRVMATGFGAQAPQNGGVLERLLGGSSFPMAEDCLFLNVFTPGCDDVRRPVLVWVHGGAYVTGTGAMPWYDGSALAARGDVVVVTINYRLGALGFLDDHNSGTLDQVAALRWVARNIEAFGGDADNVTVFGESAGGSALMALMATPAADRLFHRAIAMSPSILQLRDADQGARLAATFLDLLGVDSIDDARMAPVDAILEAQARFPASTAGLKNFSPTSGTDVIPEPILDVAAADPRPLVIGTNRDEMLLFTAYDHSRSDWTDADVGREFERRFGDDAAAAITAYRSHRPDTSPSQLVSAMQTDEVFRVPAQRVGEQRSDRGNATWMYSFDFASRAFGGVMGACHGLDIPFAFDNLSRQGAEMFTGPGDDRQRVADQFAQAIVDFAHTGDPGWPEFERDGRATQRIGLEPAVDADPDAELRALWR
ncbi:MAG: carboxylesterase/lipase family protein [Ilumatobacter sp.]|nr:carboxylesterase/lipase family protein [Ilumatobacter sp.]